METTKDRLKQFLSYLKVGQRKFESTCGISNGYINNLKDVPTNRILNMIKDAYPELNTEWLLTGTGSMLLDTEETATRVLQDTDKDESALIAELRTQIADKDAEIKYLRSLVSTLTGHNQEPQLPHVENPETDLRLKFFDELRTLVRAETAKAINEKVG